MRVHFLHLDNVYISSIELIYMIKMYTTKILYILFYIYVFCRYLLTNMYTSSPKKKIMYTYSWLVFFLYKWTLHSLSIKKYMYTSHIFLVYFTFYKYALQFLFSNFFRFLFIFFYVHFWLDCLSFFLYDELVKNDVQYLVIKRGLFFSQSSKIFIFLLGIYAKPHV